MMANKTDDIYKNLVSKLTHIQRDLFEDKVSLGKDSLSPPKKGVGILLLCFDQFRSLQAIYSRLDQCPLKNLSKYIPELQISFLETVCTQSPTV